MKVLNKVISRNEKKQYMYIVAFKKYMGKMDNFLNNLCVFDIYWFYTYSTYYFVIKILWLTKKLTFYKIFNISCGKIKYKIS